MCLKGLSSKRRVVKLVNGYVLEVRTFGVGSKWEWWCYAVCMTIGGTGRRVRGSC
jgi:hypothetical protein